MRKPTWDVSLVEDDENDAAFVLASLEMFPSLPVELVRHRTLADAIGSAHEPDLLILDLGLPDSTGLETLAQLGEWIPRPPQIGRFDRASKGTEGGRGVGCEVQDGFRCFAGVPLPP